MTRHRNGLPEFVAKVDASGGPDACHKWTGGLRSGGYGEFSVAHRNHTAHRWIFEQMIGRELGRWEFVCHTCDNRRCVNLRHLYLGNPDTNMADMKARGRGRKRHVTDVCGNGHPWNEANTYILPSTGQRCCRACTNDSQRRYYARRKAVFG